MIDGKLGGRCEHKSAIETKCDKGHHYAKRACADCGAFLGWAKNPRTVAAIAEIENKCLHLWTHPGLSDWERQFVRSIGDDPRKLSPPQNERIEALWRRTSST